MKMLYKQMGNAKSRLLGYADKASLSDAEFYELRRVMRLRSKDPMLRSAFVRTDRDKKLYASLSAYERARLRTKLVEEARRRSRARKPNA